MPSLYVGYGRVTVCINTNESFWFVSPGKGWVLTFSHFSSVVFNIPCSLETLKAFSVQSIAVLLCFDLSIWPMCHKGGTWLAIACGFLTLDLQAVTAWPWLSSYCFVQGLTAGVPGMVNKTSSHHWWNIQQTYHWDACLVWGSRVRVPEGL